MIAILVRHEVTPRNVQMVAAHRKQRVIASLGGLCLWFSSVAFSPAGAATPGAEIATRATERPASALLAIRARQSPCLFCSAGTLPALKNAIVLSELRNSSSATGSLTKEWRARRALRFGIYGMSAGLLLGAGAVALALSDPQASWAGNNGFADARRRAALTMAIPAGLFVSSGTIALIYGIVHRKEDSSSAAR